MMDPRVLKELRVLNQIKAAPTAPKAILAPKELKVLLV
jgi:hypothetical protein